MPAKPNDADNKLKGDTVTQSGNPQESPVPAGHYEPVKEGPKPKGSPVPLEAESVGMGERIKEIARVEAIFKKFSIDRANYEERRGPYHETAYLGDGEFNKNVYVQLKDLSVNLRKNIDAYTKIIGSQDILSRDSVIKAKDEFISACESHVNEALSKGLGDDLHWITKLHNLVKEFGNYVATKLTGNKSQFFTPEKSATVKGVEARVDEFQKEGEEEMEEPENIRKRPFLE